jgi:hemolysin activation/secretion protein
VLRFGATWGYSSRTQAVAARSLFSIGLDLLGATRNPGGLPDGRFFAWLGQVQWARRFASILDATLVARADVQLSDRPLLGFEQFAIGGRNTVRGYRENRLVGDNGVVGSLELRVPIPMPSWREWRPHFELAPFFDAGHSWNTDRPELGEQTLLSVGVGGRLFLTHDMLFRVYWGHPLKDVASLGESSLQDDGISLGLEWDL